MKTNIQKQFISIRYFFLLILFLFSYFNASGSLYNTLGESNGNNDIQVENNWSWSSIEIISDTSTDLAFDPDVYVDTNGGIHTVWTDKTDFPSDDLGDDRDIFYRYWNPETRDWEDIFLVSNASNFRSLMAEVVVDQSGNIHVVWQDESNFVGVLNDVNVFYRCWNASTELWMSREVLTAGSDKNVQFPSIALDSNDNLHLVWADARNHGGGDIDNEWDIFYMYRSSSTGIWSNYEPISIDSNTAETHRPDIVIDTSNNVHIVWQDDAQMDTDDALGDYDIYYRSKNSITEVWGPTTLISTGSGDSSERPRIATDSIGNVFVVWEESDDLSGSGPDIDILMKTWNKTTSLWTLSGELVSSSSSATSWYPSLCIDSSNNIHVAWSDYTNYDSSGTDADMFYTYRDATTKIWQAEIVISDLSDASVTQSAIFADDLGHINLFWDDAADYGSLGGGIVSICYKRYGAEPSTSPILDAITPNPDYDGLISLNWNDIDDASIYYLYRDTSTITSVSSLTPIETAATSIFEDTITSSGDYYYVIVAGNPMGNSSISNCESVQVELGSSTEPTNSTDPTNSTETTNNTENTDTTTGILGLPLTEEELLLLLLALLILLVFFLLLKRR